MSGGTGNPARLFLNTYTPLAASRAGRCASATESLPPFIDGSILREPDLENERPAITCLCRADKFAPRLAIGDVVVYMTAQRRWRKEGEPVPEPHRRLVAVLRVSCLFDSHERAADWYADRKMTIPSNCMVKGNNANPLTWSHRITRFGCAMSDGKLQATWDKAYRRRAERFGRVVICEPLFCSLSWDAPAVTNADLVEVFGRVPGTQNPGALPIGYLNKLARHLNLPLGVDDVVD